MEKKKFVLRIDADTMAAIEKWAADEFRSVNGQIEWILSKSLSEAGRGKQQKSAASKGNTKAGEE